MLKWWRQFRIVSKHRHQVIRNGFHLGIFWQCLKHDLSKYSPSEFNISKNYASGKHSPLLEERRENDYFSMVSIHHTGRNKHHWEYWTDFFGGKVIAKTMPWKYATEMVADMLSASKTYDPKHFSGQACYEFFVRRTKYCYMTKASEEYVAWCLKTYAEEGWKALKKKITKKKYAEICALHPQVEVFYTLKGDDSLPTL
ncbi:MAG: DUF5662 family protein [Bacillota bacterium]|nr:DUF5662 family protein [Bacillota bacterium]